MVIKEFLESIKVSTFTSTSTSVPQQLRKGEVISVIVWRVTVCNVLRLL